MRPGELRDALHRAVEGWTRESRPLAEWCASVSAMAGHPVILAPPHRAIGELIDRLVDVCAKASVENEKKRWAELMKFIEREVQDRVDGGTGGDDDVEA